MKKNLLSIALISMLFLMIQSFKSSEKITDYYSSGKIRAIGYFENGQLSDTLKKYDKEGILTEIEIPYKKGNRLLHYYKDGQIKVDVNYWKKYFHNPYIFFIAR